jgi:hypothetical protein
MNGCSKQERIDPVPESSHFPNGAPWDGTKARQRARDCGSSRAVAANTEIEKGIADRIAPAPLNALSRRCGGKLQRAVVKGTRRNEKSASEQAVGWLGELKIFILNSLFHGQNELDSMWL